jgi:MinD superfamily P-loop ATPase
MESKIPRTILKDTGDDKMKQITIISGKGGTGKTSITGSFAALSEDAVFADCDVDASNLHLLLKPKIKETIDFKGLNQAIIDPEKCNKCGICMELCKFNAINDYQVDPIHCEGCKVCVVNCPVEAINFEERICGQAYISDTKYGPMSHARLTPGMENSGKLVTLVRQNAAKVAEDEKKKLVLVDGSPGIGCPVIASIANIDLSVVVVEPTLSGIHDLNRALDLLSHFQISPRVIINKFDLNRNNTNDIDAYCGDKSIKVLGHIPFDPAVTESMVSGTPIVEYRPESDASKAIIDVWKVLLEELS